LGEVSSPQKEEQYRKMARERVSKIIEKTEKDYDLTKDWHLEEKIK